MKPKRQKYNSGIGIIHKLRINEVSKKGFFTLQESFIINLNLALLKWFDFMVADKKKQGKTLKLHYYDLPNLKYLNELQKILIELKGGQEK